MTTATTAAQAETTVNLTAANRASAAYCLRELTKNYAKHIAWQASCTYYSAAEEAGLNPDEPKGMPSKQAKYNMYSDASRLISMLNLTVARPSNLAGIGEVITAALAAVRRY